MASTIIETLTLQKFECNFVFEKLELIKFFYLFFELWRREIFLLNSKFWQKVRLIKESHFKKKIENVCKPTCCLSMQTDRRESGRSVYEVGGGMDDLVSSPVEI